jgi:hypothetical protein
VLKLVSDENFNADILRGLYRQDPDLDVVRVQDIGLKATPDSDILAWAAAEGRILLTHDRDTMPYHAYERVRAAQPMPGMFLVSDRTPPLSLTLPVCLFDQTHPSFGPSAPNQHPVITFFRV